VSRNNNEWPFPTGAWSSGCCPLPNTQTPRNCCFEHRELWGRGWELLGWELDPRVPMDLTPFLFPHSGHHEWLLGPEVDILPFLLLPLAGPEDFSEEEMDREWLEWMEPQNWPGRREASRGRGKRKCPSPGPF
jgi:hypothetical protein